MIRAGGLLVLLAGPVAAETGLCETAWARVAEGLGGFGTVTATGVAQEGDWCVVLAPVLDVDGQYVPDWRMDRLRFRGAALGWIADGSSLPEGLEIAVEGLRLAVQTGNAQVDWLLAAQARPNGIDAEAALAWDPVAKVLRLERLSLDFPGENRVDASAVVTGVDLSSTGAMQMSLASFALTEAELRVQTHGLFEGYALMALGSALLPPEGDMDAAAEGLRAEALAAIGDLPGTSFSDASKAALRALVGELPNPAGDLAVTVKAEPGIGPVRFGGYAVTGVPATVAAAAPVFEGVKVDVGWTHADAP
ncbi:hypothetical protein [Tabrizicola sp.]|uniref:hypothetical protein n=1 Tax=Tabrizicola sp. TaxID=2005166 RepID=UPI0035AFD751